MKIKNKVFETLGKNIEEIGRVTMPVMTSYKIAKNINNLREAAKPYFETKKSIIEKYQVIENKRSIILPDKLDEVNKEVNELVEIETDVKIEKIKLTDNIPPMPVNVMIDLDFMFEE